MIKLLLLLFVLTTALYTSSTSSSKGPHGDRHVEHIPRDHEDHKDHHEEDHDTRQRRHAIGPPAEMYLVAPDPDSDIVDAEIDNGVKLQLNFVPKNKEDSDIKDKTAVRGSKATLNSKVGSYSANPKSMSSGLNAALFKRSTPGKGTRIESRVKMHIVRHQGGGEKKKGVKKSNRRMGRRKRKRRKKKGRRGRRRRRRGRKKRRKRGRRRKRRKRRRGGRKKKRWRKRRGRRKGKKRMRNEGKRRGRNRRKKRRNRRKRKSERRNRKKEPNLFKTNNLQDKDPRKIMFTKMNKLLTDDNSVLLRVPLDKPALGGQPTSIHHVQYLNPRGNQKSTRRQRKMKITKKRTQNGNSGTHHGKATKNFRLNHPKEEKFHAENLHTIEYDLTPHHLSSKDTKNPDKQMLTVESVVTGTNGNRKADIKISSIPQKAKKPPENPEKPQIAPITRPPNIPPESKTKVAADGRPKTPKTPTNTKPGAIKTTGPKSSSPTRYHQDKMSHAQAGHANPQPYDPSKDYNSGYPSFTRHHRHHYESVYVPHNFLPYLVNQTHGLDMRGNYTFYDKVNRKIYGHRFDERGYWLWKKQLSVKHIDGHPLDVHNNVVLQTILAFGITFAVLLCGILLIGCDNELLRSKRNNVHVVQTRDEMGNYPYLVHIHTGRTIGCTTSGIVHFAMQGRHGTSEEYTLTPLDETYRMKQDKFRPGKEDVFLLYTHEDIGDLVLVELELECIGGASGASWSLDYVTISDLQRDAHWYFPSHKTFRTNDGFDHHVIMKETSGGGNKLLSHDQFDLYNTPLESVRNTAGQDRYLQFAEEMIGGATAVRLGRRLSYPIHPTLSFLASQHEFVTKLVTQGHKLFYDNLRKTFLMQHVYLSLLFSEQNQYRWSIIVRLCLVWAYAACVMAGNLFIFVRPMVDYSHYTGLPHFSDVVWRGFLLNLVIGMFIMMLEIVSESMEGNRTSIEDRVLCYVNQNQSMGFASHHTPTTPTHHSGHDTTIDVDPDYEMLNQSAIGGHGGRYSTFSVPGSHTYNGNNQNANNELTPSENTNQNAISVQHPVKKKRTLMDVFQGFKSRRKNRNNAAVQMTYSDSSDSESSETDSDSTETSSLLHSTGHKKPPPNYQSNLTVPPPPMVPPLARFSSFNSSEMSDDFYNPNRNVTANLNTLPPLPTIPEETLDNERDSQNINNNMGFDENPVLEEDTWLNRLKDALVDSHLNLVIEDNNVILETPGDVTWTEQSKETLIESLKGLLLICKDRNQAMMLSNIVYTLQQLGHLSTDETLSSDIQQLYDRLPRDTDNPDVGDIDTAWRKVWDNDIKPGAPKGYKVIADRDSVKEFTIRLCEKISEFAKESVKTGNVKVPLDDLQCMLRSFLASNSRIKTIKPHQAYFLQNISADGLDVQRRHSDSSLNESTNKRDGELQETLLDGKCSSETSILSAKTTPKPTTGLYDRPSITDIHEQMGLRPVTRKLSDSVMCVAFEKNSSLIEQQSTELLRRRSQSREDVFQEICSEILPDEVIVTEKQKEEQEEEEPVPPKVSSSSKSILESVLPAHCLKLGQDSLHQIANASLQSVLSSDLGLRLRDSLDTLKENELRNFTREVVDRLFQVVRGKVAKLLHEQELKDHPDGEKEDRTLRLLEKADEEVRESIIPVITSHIVRLIEDEAQTLETIDVDLMMMSYAGQFVETIVTNAVLQTNVCLLNNVQALSKPKFGPDKEQFDDVNLDSEDPSPTKDLVSYDPNRNNNANSNNNNNPNRKPRGYLTSDPHWKPEWTDMLVSVVEKLHHRLWLLLPPDTRPQSSLGSPEAMDRMLNHILSSAHVAQFLLQSLFRNALEIMPSVVAEVQGKLSQCPPSNLVHLGEALIKDVASTKQLEMMHGLTVEVGDKIIILAIDRLVVHLIELLKLEKVAKSGGCLAPEQDEFDLRALQEEILMLRERENTNPNENNNNNDNNNAPNDPQQQGMTGTQLLTGELKDIRETLLTSMRQPLGEFQDEYYNMSGFSPRQAGQGPAWGPSTKGSPRRGSSVPGGRMQAHSSTPGKPSPQRSSPLYHGASGAGGFGSSGPVTLGGGIGSFGSPPGAGGGLGGIASNLGARVAGASMSASGKPSALHYGAMDGDRSKFSSGGGVGGHMGVGVAFRGICGHCGIHTGQSELFCGGCDRYMKYRTNYKPANLQDIEDPGPPIVAAAVLVGILLFLIVTCYVLVIRYGVGFHQKLAHQWISAVFIGLCVHFFILEPLKVLLVTYHLSFTNKRVMH